MLTFLAALLRVLIGFALACLAAGLVQALFAVTPSEIASADDDRVGIALTWGLQSATLIGLFAAPFAFIAVLISEWRGLHSFAYHALVAMAIAAAGFGLLQSTESPTEASIVNSYAMAAFLTSGFVGGLVYWVFAGHWARKRGQGRVRMENDRTTGRPSPPRPAADRAAPDGSGNARLAARGAERGRDTAGPGPRPGTGGPGEREGVRGRLGRLSDRLLRAKPREPTAPGASKPMSEKPMTENARMAAQRSTGSVPATRPPATTADAPPANPAGMPKPSGSAS